MRILQISTRLILGGSQENVVLACEGLAERGHDVHLAFGPIYGPEGSMLERVRAFRTSDGRAITTHELPNMVREIHPIKDHLCFHHDLKQMLRQVQPDVVHTHSSKAGILGRWATWVYTNERRPAWHDLFPFSWAASFVNPENARPQALSIHTIHGPPFMPVEGSPLKRLIIRAKNAAYTAAERFAAERSHKLVSIADAMTEQFLARGIGSRKQYIQMHSGLNVDAYLHAAPGESREQVRAQLGIDPGDLVIGTVARLAEHKGHDDLLDALGQSLVTQKNWKLLWVGDGWWRERLEGRIRSMGLERSVIRTGLVSPDRIPAMMRAMDILAHPSYREGLPRTIPQALLAGVVPVAYDCDGTPEACRDPSRHGDSASGRLVETGDVNRLREVLIELALDPDQRRLLAKRGQAWATDAFRAERLIDELESLYRTLASQHRIPVS